jgi:hypothetical protein
MAHAAGTATAFRTSLAENIRSDQSPFAFVHMRCDAGGQGTR